MISEIGPYDVSAPDYPAILPGLVDTHVHINEPGRTDWEGFETATLAARAGGITTLVEMPLNAIPSTNNVAALQMKRGAARGKCHVRTEFWGGVVPGNAQDLGPLMAAGARGFKCFLTPSGTPDFEYVTEADLRLAMPVLNGAVLQAHCEMPALLVASPEGDPNSYTTYLKSRPPEAEHAAIELMIRLAREFDARVHIVHFCASGALSLLHGQFIPAYTASFTLAEETPAPAGSWMWRQEGPSPGPNNRVLL